MSIVSPDTLALAERCEAALRGQTHNTGSFTVPAGAAGVLLRDPRLGTEQVVSVIPTDAVAAALQPWVERRGRGECAVRFSQAASRACGFDYMIVGVRRHQGRAAELTS